MTLLWIWPVQPKFVFVHCSDMLSSRGQAGLKEIISNKTNGLINCEKWAISLSVIAQCGSWLHVSTLVLHWSLTGRPIHGRLADVSCGNLRAATKPTSLGWTVSSRHQFVGGICIDCALAFTGYVFETHLPGYTILIVTGLEVIIGKLGELESVSLGCCEQKHFQIMLESRQWRR